MAGRPLRFLLLLLGGWVGGRTAMLWPTADTAGTLIREVFTGRAHAAPAGSVTMVVPPPRPLVRSGAVGFAKGIVTAVPAGRPLPDPARIRLALLGFLSFGPAEDVAGNGVPSPASAPPAGPWPAGVAAPVKLLSRWSGSMWLVARGAGPAGVAPGAGQIGGSQGGARLGWSIDPARRLTLVGRLATPFAGIGREASLGVEWRPTRLPVRLVAERRVALDKGTGGFGAGAIGGLPPTPLPLDFALEGYAEAGAIRRAATEPYADGAVRLTRAVAAVGGLRLDLGVGAWGAAQRGAQRLDLGPSLGVAVPAAGRMLRLSLDCGIM